MPLGRLFESAWYNPILKAVPMSMGILMSGNAGYAIAGNMSDNVVIVQQQTISVTGTVIDASGEPLVGVNIVEAGTVNGVISDFEGKFTLNVKPNATLKISYIGYIAQNILVKGQKNLTITLQEDTETLDEVVVVGYGTVRKADLAGSVSVLDSRNFKDQPITQVSDALQGRVAGVNVVSDGVPGGSVKIRIRGTNSINKSNDPLYVVDGMVRESGLEGINPEDIQSMQILNVQKCVEQPAVIKRMTVTASYIMWRPIINLLSAFRQEWISFFSPIRHRPFWRKICRMSAGH